MSDPSSYLQSAVHALDSAVDSRGLKVLLVQKPYDIDDVRRTLWNMCQWHTAESVWLDNDGEMNAARNLSLVADLLTEHLRYAKIMTELRPAFSACSPQTS